MSDVLDLTCDLIRRASVTPADDGCQAVIAGRLVAAGFACEHLRFGDVDNLWATHGDAASGPTLVLLGHTDVVPPGPREAWASDPFAPEIRDGVLYGRGAADMKGSVAAFVIAAEQFVRAHPRHAGDLLRQQDAVDLSLDLLRDLVGVELVERLAAGDRVALALEPADDRALGQRLAHLRHDDMRHPMCTPSQRAQPVIPSAWEPQAQAAVRSQPVDDVLSLVTQQQPTLLQPELEGAHRHPRTRVRPKAPEVA